MGVFNNAHEAWEFLQKHPMVEYEGVSNFRSCLEIEIVKYNPVTGEIDENGRLNTASKVCLEFGRWVPPEDLSQEARSFHPYGAPEHDIDLDCGSPTFEEAIIDLAAKVLQQYGARCPECGVWRQDDDRLKVRMRCGPCAYGYPFCE